jgi:hypothetical protein
MQVGNERMLDRLARAGPGLAQQPVGLAQHLQRDLAPARTMVRGCSHHDQLIGHPRFDLHVIGMAGPSIRPGIHFEIDHRIDDVGRIATSARTRAPAWLRR